MQIKANTPDQYVDQLPDDRKEVIDQLIKSNPVHLPGVFTDTITYGNNQILKTK